jgi:hypothetical protein
MRACVGASNCRNRLGKPRRAARCGVTIHSVSLVLRPRKCGQGRCSGGSRHVCLLLDGKAVAHGDAHLESHLCSPYYYKYTPTALCLFFFPLHNYQLIRSPHTFNPSTPTTNQPHIHTIKMRFSIAATTLLAAGAAAQGGLLSSIANDITSALAVPTSVLNSITSAAGSAASSATGGAGSAASSAASAASSALSGASSRIASAQSSASGVRSSIVNDVSSRLASLSSVAAANPSLSASIASQESGILASASSAARSVASAASSAASRAASTGAAAQATALPVMGAAAAGVFALAGLL